MARTHARGSLLRANHFQHHPANSTRRPQFQRQPLRDYMSICFWMAWCSKVRDLPAKCLVAVCWWLTARCSSGKRQILSLPLRAGESETAWLEFLQDLYLRRPAWQKPKLIVTDGCKGLRAALPLSFPVFLNNSAGTKLRNIAEKVRRTEGPCVAEAAPSIAPAARTRRCCFRLWLQAWPTPPSQLAWPAWNAISSNLLSFFRCPNRTEKSPPTKLHSNAPSAKCADAPSQSLLHTESGRPHHLRRPSRNLNMPGKKTTGNRTD